MACLAGKGILFFSGKSSLAHPKFWLRWRISAQSESIREDSSSDVGASSTRSKPRLLCSSHKVLHSLSGPERIS
jgi:hypothetical protein